MKKSLKAFLIFAVLVAVESAFMMCNGYGVSSAFALGKLISLILVYIGCCYAFDKYETVVADVPDLKSYISQLFYNRPDKFVWCLYKFPKNWKATFAYWGYTLVYAMIVYEAVRDFEWLGVTFHFNMNGYYRFRETFCFGRADYTFTLISFIPITYIWIVKEYKKSRTALEKIRA